MESPPRILRRSRRLQTAPTITPWRARGKGCNTTCLPIDIVLFEILPWLPVRTILKLKCVCRDWHRLLSGGGGRESHHRLAVEQFERGLRHPSPAASGTIYFKPGGNKLFYHSFDGTFLELPIQINQSSSSRGICIRNIMTSTNGLCCFYCFRRHPGRVTKPNAFIYICNPFTGRSGEEVPLNHGESLEPISRRLRAFALTFEPSEVDYKLVSFGWIPSSRIVPGGHRDEFEFRFSLYSSGSGSWVESGSKFTIVSHVNRRLQALCSRTFYGEGKVYLDCYTFAVQYDIGRDAGSLIKMPGFHQKYTFLRGQHLELLEGRLTCTRLSKKPDNCLEVWALLPDGGNKECRWELKERVMIRLILGKDPTSGHYPLGATVYEDEERRLCIQMMMHGSRIINSGLVHYNIREKKVVCVRIYQYEWHWNLIDSLIYRHHDILHDVPSRAML